MTIPEPFNPLSKVALAESVVNRLLESRPSPLPPDSTFVGAGIYAIYYIGDLPQYAPIAGGGADTPIYVGKAVPQGARVGGFDLTANVGSVLHSRLREHAKSVESAGFPPTDFQCRYLVVEDIWIPLAEQLMISLYRPVWNHIVHGFGNHAPGTNRSGAARPLWDEVHPGRSWAEGMGPAKMTAAEIWSRVEDHFRGEYVTEDVPPDE